MTTDEKKPAPYKVRWEKAFFRYSGAPLPARGVAALYATYASADGGDVRPGRDALVQVVDGLSLSALKKWTKFLVDAGWLTVVGGGYGDTAKEYRLTLPEGFDLAAEELRESEIRQENRARKLAGVKVEPLARDHLPGPGKKVDPAEGAEPAGPMPDREVPGGPIPGTCGSDLSNLGVRDRTPTNAATNSLTNSTTTPTGDAPSGAGTQLDPWAASEAEPQRETAPLPAAPVESTASADPWATVEAESGDDFEAARIARLVQLAPSFEDEPLTSPLSDDVEQAHDEPGPSGPELPEVDWDALALSVAKRDGEGQEYQGTRYRVS